MNSWGLFFGLFFFVLSGAAAEAATAAPQAKACSDFTLHTADKGFYELQQVLGAYKHKGQLVEASLRQEGLIFRFYKTQLKTLPNKRFKAMRLHNVYKVRVQQDLSRPQKSNIYQYFKKYAFVATTDWVPFGACWLEWSGRRKGEPHKEVIFQGLGLINVKPAYGPQYGLGSFATTDDEGQENFVFKFVANPIK